MNTVNSTTVRVFGGQYREDHVLYDGAVVFLKTIGSDDKGSLLDAFERLSPESRFLRFFAAKPALSEREARYFTEIDGESHFAIAAGRRRADGATEGLGIARFVCRATDHDEAELAVAVVDDWQGRGLGRILLARLVAAAQERGLKRLVGTVMAENDAMIHLLATTAKAELSLRGGFVEAIVEVGEPEKRPRGRHSISEDPQVSLHSQ